MAAQVLTFSPPSTPSPSYSIGSTPANYQGGNQMHHTRGGSSHRTAYNQQNGTGYRGVGASGPVPSYAFVATPQLNQTHNPLRQNPTGLRHEDRSASAPVASQQPRPLLALDTPPAVGHTHNSNKPSPDRYRRVQRTGSSPATPPAGSAQPSGSGMAAVGHLYHHSTQSLASPALDNSRASTDDININRHSGSEQAKRYRRRSINSIGADDAQAGVQPLQQQQQQVAPSSGMPRSYAAVASSTYTSSQLEPRFTQATAMRPSSAHGRNSSNESSSSSVRSSSRPRSVSALLNQPQGIPGTTARSLGSAALTGMQARREAGSVPSPSTNSPIPTASSSPHSTAPSAQANNAKPGLSVPARGSSDVNKRLANPSPLSQPMTMGSESADALPRHNATSSSAQPESPAAKQLAALNRKEEEKKGKPSRLRRAFSFGSAAELRKASAANIQEQNERKKLQKPQYQTEEEAREAAIVAQQEASGLGASIYSGQGNFFTGSTDNLSVSSTASSASIMLRKMGKGVKKGTKSLVGLFRPKSVIGVPAADAAVPEPSMAQVSMVTVEAERDNVNVNLHPDEATRGGTGFPKLERNSVDVARNSVSNGTLDSSDSRSRRSIVGGERERAEVLAAVKKGILKRAGTDSGASSPSARPSDLKPASDYVLPQIPRFSDSPVSSAPSTPKDEVASRGVHKRTDSVSIEGDDYFINAKLAANGDSSLPGSPRNGQRGITFSPKIQFHDTWPSGEYDRRGDIATCNRLTPTLAQQIKEELNSFKMEMEVHESSKIYTHFF